MITYKIKKGTTNVSVVCRAIDSTDGTPETTFDHSTTGIDLKYRRETAANVDITEAALAALTTAHADGGVEQIGNGYFRLDLPDAACASGVDGVMVHGVATGMVIIGCYIQLVDYDPFDSVRMGMTSLPNAAADAAGGLPISDVGELDMDALNTAATRLTAARAQVLDDWINAGRLDAILDIIAADVVNLDGAAMRGTDGANTVVPDAAGVAPTAVEVRQEIDTNSTKSGYALSATGLDLILFNSVFLLASAKANWIDDLTTYTNGMAGKRLKGLSAVFVVEGTVNDASATTTTFITTLTGYGTDFFIDTEISVEITNDQWQPRVVTAYNTTTGQMTVDEALISAPADTSRIALTMRHVHSISSINAEMDTALIDYGANTVVPDAAGTAPTAVEVRQEIDSNSTQLNTTLPALIDDLAVKKNTAFSNFEFLMVLTSDHATPATGLTVTGERSINGSAFAGVSGTIAEVSNGIYQFDALAADTNGDVITWRFSSGTADDTFVTFKTVA